MHASKKHKSHVKGKRSKHRPFGKFGKFSKKEEHEWLSNSRSWRPHDKKTKADGRGKASKKSTIHEDNRQGS